MYNFDDIRTKWVDFKYDLRASINKKIRKYEDSSNIFLRITLSKIPNSFKTMNDLYYNLKCKYYLKYHTVRIDVDRFNYNGITNKKTLKNYHWVDSDTTMLFAMFQILVDYIEIEQPYDLSDESNNDPIRTETLFLYKWWTELRPKRIASVELPHLDERLTKYRFFKLNQNPALMPSPQEQFELDEYRKKIREWDEHEKLGDQEDTQMLIRLVKIRQTLWT